MYRRAALTRSDRSAAARRRFSFALGLGFWVKPAVSFFLRDLTTHGRWPRVADVVSGARRDPRARSVHHGYVFPRLLRLVLHRVASDDRPAPFKRPTLAGGTRRRGPRSVRPRGRLDLPRRGHQLLLPRVLLGRRGWLVRARVGRRGARRGPGPEAERRQSLELPRRVVGAREGLADRARGLQRALPRRARQTHRRSVAPRPEAPLVPDQLLGRLRCDPRRDSSPWKSYPPFLEKTQL